MLGIARANLRLRHLRRSTRAAGRIAPLPGDPGAANSGGMGASLPAPAGVGTGRTLVAGLNTVTPGKALSVTFKSGATASFSLVYSSGNPSSNSFALITPGDTYYIRCPTDGSGFKGINGSAADANVALEEIPDCALPFFRAGPSAISNIPGANVITVTPNGGPGGDGGQYGPNTPNTGTSGLQEAFNAAAASSIKGVVEVGGVHHLYTGTTQLVLKNGVVVRWNGNGYKCTVNTIVVPVTTDVGPWAGNSIYDMLIDGNSFARTDQTITVTASPFTYTNSSNEIQYVTVDGGTTTAIQYNGGTSAGTTGVFQLSPTDTLIVTYSAGAPTMLQLAGPLVLGPTGTSGQVNAIYRTIIQNASGGAALSRGLNLIACCPRGGGGTGTSQNTAEYRLFGLTVSAGSPLRFIGAGLNNGQCTLNYVFDAELDAVGTGGTNAAYGINFAKFSDTNTVLNVRESWATTAANSGAAVVFNDGTGGAATDTRVNANRIWTLAADLSTNSANLFMVLTNAAGLTANSPANTCDHFFYTGTSPTTVVSVANGGLFNGKDERALVEYYQSIKGGGQNRPFIVAAGTTTGVATNVQIFSYTPPSKAGQYRLNVNVRVTAAGTTLNWTGSYGNGGAKTPTFNFIAEGGTALTTNTNTGTRYSMVSYVFDIDTAGTAISLSSANINGVTATVVWSLEQLQ